jgi:hypothetical protein
MPAAASRWATLRAPSKGGIGGTGFSVLRALTRVKLLVRKDTQVHPSRNGAASIEEACTLLMGSYDEWERRVAVIGSVPPLLRAKEGADLEQAMRNLIDPLSKQLADLRSATVRAACYALCAIAEAQTAAAASLAAGVLPALLKNAYVTVKVISQESAKAGACIVARAPSNAMIKVLLTFTKDEHHQSRTCAVGVIGQLVANAEFAVPPKALPAVMSALRTLIEDSNSATRNAAASTYWQIQARFPKEAETWLKAIAAKEQKLVKSKTPKSLAG